MQRYADTFFRSWFIVLIPILVLPAAAVVMNLKATPSKQVISTIEMSDSGVKMLGYTNPYNTPAQNMQAGLGQWLGTQAFDLRVAKDSPTYLQSMSVPGGSVANAVTADLSSHVTLNPIGPNILQVFYTTKDAASGVEVVKAIMREGSRQIVQLDKQAATKSVAAYKQQEAAAHIQVLRATTQFNNYVHSNGIPTSQIPLLEQSDPTLNGLYQNVQSAQTQESNAIQGIAQTQATQSQLGSPYKVVDQPIVTNASSRLKSLLLPFLIMLGAGLALGLGFVVVRTVLDRSLRFAEEAVVLVGIPVLAVVPAVNKKQVDSLAGVSTARERQQQVGRSQISERSVG